MIVNCKRIVLLILGKYLFEFYYVLHALSKYLIISSNEFTMLR